MSVLQYWMQCRAVQGSHSKNGSRCSVSAAREPVCLYYSTGCSAGQCRAAILRMVHGVQSVQLGTVCMYYCNGCILRMVHCVQSVQHLVPL